jgi:hypothetical protein
VKKIVLLMIVTASLTVVPIVSAGSSLLNAYGGSGATPVVGVKGGTVASAVKKAKAVKVVKKAKVAATATAPVKGSGPGTLPFTGSDLAIFVALGSGLVVAGFGLRKLGRDES